MDIAYPLFCGLCAVAGWAAGWLWNKHEVATACLELAQELNERHDLAMKTVTEALGREITENSILRNGMVAAFERRTQLAVLPERKAVGE